MKRLITAPCVGIVVGALELGTLFGVPPLFDSCQGCFLGSGSDWAYLFATFGMIGGGIIGGIIGLAVAVKDANGRSGLFLGCAIGFAVTVLVGMRARVFDDPLANWVTVALVFVPMGASIAFLSAVATAPSKEPPTMRPAEAEPSRSHRIFE
ncbi:MAG TPA: hypothetical protein VJP89_22485 [Pyrinomonadaceae bacterium]|nr:hypothetical protein [Pyrinomonadaceae bacterium]